eukprot:Gb_30324 [translate_table: standard]
MTPIFLKEIRNTNKIPHITAISHTSRSLEAFVHTRTAQKFRKYKPKYFNSAPKSSHMNQIESGVAFGCYLYSLVISFLRFRAFQHHFLNEKSNRERCVTDFSFLRIGNKSSLESVPKKADNSNQHQKMVNLKQIELVRTGLIMRLT